ncbi:Pantothenate kinase 2 [Glycine max]|nr:Pantothenate kinase 2 [Glycine max]
MRTNIKKILPSNMALMHRYGRNLWQPAKPLIGRKKMQEIQKNNDCPHLLSRGGYDLLEKKLLDEKIKKRQHDALMTENPALIEDLPSPIQRHVKWKMARTNRYGMMTSKAARQIADKIDSLKEQVTQGEFVPQGRQDILNTTIGIPDHGGRVRAAGSGVTISQYYGRTSRASTTSSISFTKEQLVEIVVTIREQVRNEIEEEKKRSLHAWKNELKDAIITDIFNGDKVSAPANFDLNVLGARVSTKESNAEIVVNPSGEEHVGRVTPPMGLYVQSQDCTKLVALGKIHDGPSTIHCVAYADDVVRVSVEKVIDGEAEVPLATSEIKYVRDVVNTFIAWPLPLVKLVSNEHSGITPDKAANAAELNNDVPKQDPLHELIKTLVEIYDKPVEFVWDLTKFGIPNVNSLLFLTYTNVSEITSGEKCLNIAILQFWTMYMNEWSNGLGHRSVYGFLEPQSIHNAKDRRGQCEEYIEKWLKESQRQLYIGAYLNDAHWQMVVLCPKDNVVVWFCLVRRRPDVHIKTAINKLIGGYNSEHYINIILIFQCNAYKKLNTTADGKVPKTGPQWLELKTHIQRGGYECGYYVMHWMWNIIGAELKSDWSVWFGDGSALDPEAITTLRKKWVAYFLKLRTIQCTKLICSAKCKVLSSSMRGRKHTIVTAETIKVAIGVLVFASDWWKWQLWKNWLTSDHSQQQQQETTLLTLIEGVLAANIFDWGSHACVDLYHKGTILEIYRISHNKMQRPWRVDDFHAFKQRMLGTGDKKPPLHRRALLFKKKLIYIGAYNSNDIVGHAFNGGRCRCNDVPDLKSLRFNVVNDIDNVFEGCNYGREVIPVARITSF